MDPSSREAADGPTGAAGGLPDLMVYAEEAADCCERLVRLGRLAIPLCLANARDNGSPICHLTEIEVTLVTDEQIAGVHGEFLDDPTPTDVITFHHGEILISMETAQRQSADSGLAIEDELLLYLIHGLLHLGNWDDHEPEEALKMATLQDEILKTVLNQPR